MRVDVFVPTVSAEEQVDFYVNQLGLFEIAQDYGMGNLLLKFVNNPEFCLLLKKSNQSVLPVGPLFCISTKNCRAEFSRLSKVNFHKGGLVPGPDGLLQVFEYPLGENIFMKDPSGNSFVIAQWHENAY